MIDKAAFTTVASRSVISAFCANGLSAARWSGRVKEIVWWMVSEQDSRCRIAKDNRHYFPFVCLDNPSRTGTSDFLSLAALPRHSSPVSSGLIPSHCDTSLVTFFFFAVILSGIIFSLIMSASLPSDEVVEDYKSSLDDLVNNDRSQISILTMIAKENIEHAEAISRVIQNHITRVSRRSTPYQHEAKY